MQSNVKKAQVLKLRQYTLNDSNTSGKHPVTCYFTLGCRTGQWHMWNTSPSALTLRRGDLLRASILASDFNDTTGHLTRVLADVTIGGLGNTTCLLGRDIYFDSLEQIPDLQSVATQGDFVAMCMSKGVTCASFLEHYTQYQQDEELQLGEKLHCLFSQTVRDMLSKRYDVMHHYPLYNRALGLYYSDKVSLEPPELSQMLATGGLLDRCAEDHQSLHGIPLVGVDHISFSHWKYPEDREARLEEDRECKVLHVGDKGGLGDEVLLKVDHNTIKCYDEVDDSAGRPTLGEPSVREILSPVSPFPTEEMTAMYAVTTLETFNNLPGTLTDRPRAFPYTFTVFTSHDLTFDQLVNYCITRTREPLSMLPSREKWGSVNPVLLMEDPVDPATGNTVHRYTVTSRGHLSTTVANRDSTPPLCYNEVFLPGRPVSRLNLDVDLKCCQTCNKKFATEADRSTKRKVSAALTTSLILVIVESLMRLVKAKMIELETDSSLRELAKVVGKIAVYVRASSVKAKLSLRMLWYLPVELCSVDGIEAYRPLLDEMERVSMKYVLLSYPADADSCGLCNLGHAMRKGPCNSSGSGYLRLNSDLDNRRSSIDKGPYSFRKSVRLPNCYKNNSGFEYVDTFNTQDIEDPGCDDPLSLSVGLSSNPILSDVTSIGSRFRCVLKGRGYCQPFPVSVTEGVPNQTRVESEAGRLTLLWGVPVTIRKTGSGLFCVQATETSTTYPCPIHKRVHSKSKLGALVFATQTKPKCFVT